MAEPVNIDVKWIAERRERNYRRKPALRVQTQAEARSFVEQTGFCHFWPCQGAELPNLFHAIAGRIRAVPNEHDDADIGKCWGWKDEALDKRWWYYGKLIKRRATLVSLELLPAFYACSENYGDFAHDFLEEYRDGRISLEAKNIYEALLENGPLDTVELRKRARLANDSAKYKFEKTLTALQTGLKVIPIGVAPVGAWKYAFRYEILPRWYADVAERARPLSRREAQKTLVLRHLQNVVAATRDEVYKTLDVLGWTKAEFEGVIGVLIDARQVREAPADGSKNLYLVSKSAIDALG